MSRFRAMRSCYGMTEVRAAVFVIIGCGAFLQAYAKGADNNYFFTPVERSYAEIQPSIYSHSRQQDELTDRSGVFRTSPFEIQDPRNYPQESFPSPNYNQNPAPFQLPTGRSQQSNPYYLNQANYKQPYRGTIRPYSVAIEATNRPEIHSYQHDPAQPEVFLGQITLNNPDTDHLNENDKYRYPYDDNTVKSGNSQLLSGAEYFNSQRITTYNPSRIPQRATSRPRLVKTQNRGSDFFDQSSFGKLINTHNPEIANNKQNIALIETQKVSDISTQRNTFKDAELANAKSIRNYVGFRHEADIEADFVTSKNIEKPVKNESIVKTQTQLPVKDITTYKPFRKVVPTNKGAYALQPLLEDISDFNVQNHHSDHVEVVKAKDIKPDSVKSNYFSDSNPSASTFNSGNSPFESNDQENSSQNIEQVNTVNQTEKQMTDQNVTDPPFEEELEYYEYEEDSPTTDKASTFDDEYEEEVETSSKDINPASNFEILNLSSNKTMVEEDKFKDFVDKPIMDSADIEEFPETTTFDSIEEDDKKDSIEQEVVSVVTTKSVVNGTYSVPEVTMSPVTPKISLNTTLKQSQNDTKVVSSTSIPNTTENWVVVASVQTSRSVSGARFLPFPAVEQEEKKQLLTEEEEEAVTKNPMDSIYKNSTNNTSTESINDKLDSIQSELASSVLSGKFKEDNKNIALLKEIPIIKDQTTTPSPIRLFTLKSTTPIPSPEKSAPEPPPVLIKKFTPFTRTTTRATPITRTTTTTRSTTTVKQKTKPTFELIKDDLTGLLPPGFKPKPSFKDRKKLTSTSTTTEEPALPSSEESVYFGQEPISSLEEAFNSTQARSSGLTSKNKLTSSSEKVNMPGKFKKPEPKPLESLFSNVKVDDISKFLPPGFNLNSTITTEKPVIVKSSLFGQLNTSKIKLNFPTTSTTKIPQSKILEAATPVDISSFLPPGFKLENKESVTNLKTDILSKVKPVDVSKFLPPGYTASPEEATSPLSATSTPKSPAGFKIVFPSRPGGKTTRKTTPKPSSEQGPGALMPTIHKGWPTRASTEFTGWPTPSTTPFSIEKLLAERNATASTYEHEEVTVKATVKTTTTTTTTTTPPPTTPGLCSRDCELAATIKIVGGVNWVPELLDHNTQEWKQLANEVSESLNSVYSSNEELRKWYKGVRIDAFSKGSVLVDYFVELNNVESKVDTVELKQLFHNTLHKAKPGSVVVEVEEEKPFNPDLMVGDQPDEERLLDVKKTIDQSDGKLELGKFVMDPIFTEFIVLPKRVDPMTVNMSDQDGILPQWGIAVIVIALASLLFVVIFGVTVLVNRQKSAKAKQPIPLSEDMLRELDKSHMGGLPEHPKEREMYVKERELYPPPGKRLSASMLDQLAYPGAPGDSWRSEWTPQLQKYMQQQHYAPDSGRGSQIYGAQGNTHYGYGSQIYGYGGSQVYGYHGEGIPRTHFSRRRSAYDGGF